MTAFAVRFQKVKRNVHSSSKKKKKTSKDCCDGTDESPGVCKNNCREMGAQLDKDIEEKIVSLRAVRKKAERKANYYIFFP